MCWLCSTALDGIEDPSAEQNRNLGMGDGFALAASEAQIPSQFPSHSSSFVAVPRPTDSPLARAGERADGLSEHGCEDRPSQRPDRPLTPASRHDGR
jgi:hypothetical protein